MVLKRLAAPKFWKIEKKTKKFVVHPTPGPHNMRSCLPISMILRDMLHNAQNMKEAKTILRSGAVKVDGKTRMDDGFPAGLMDVVAVGDETYRILPDTNGMTTKKIDKKESSIKLLRIENKSCIKKGRMQLNFHDGKNIVIDKNDYKTGDVLVFDFVDGKVKSALKFEKGCKALIIKGNNIGTVVTVEDIITTKSSMPNQVVVDVGERKFTLPKSYLFAVGKDEPVIKIGE